jgi:hypothetical protein
VPAVVAKEAEEKEGADERRINNEKLRNPMHFERSWDVVVETMHK